MQVLIAVDGSAISFEAVRQAAKILSPSRDELTFYCSPPGVEMLRGSAGEVASRGRRAMADAVFAEASGNLPAEWPREVRTMLGTSDPREGLLAAAEDCHSDLIVVGSRGLSRIKRAILGSVSRAVAHAAKIPVLIVPPREEPLEPVNYRVLLAFEDVKSGQQMARALRLFTWPAGTSAVSLNVVQSIIGGAIPDWLGAQVGGPDADAFVKLWVEQHDQQLAAAAQQIRDVCHELPDGLADTGHCVREGSPEEAIVRLAQVERSDLIVIGAKGSTPLGRLLIGSTTESVLNHAPCSVLILRRPE